MSLRLTECPSDEQVRITDDIKYFSIISDSSFTSNESYEMNEIWDLLGPASRPEARES